MMDQMRQNRTHRGRRRIPLARLLAVSAVVLPLAACDTDQILDVTDPALVPPSGVNSPEAVLSLYNGAVRDFNVAYSGAGDDSFLIGSALLSDELYNGDTFTTRIATDQRAQFAPQAGNTTDAAYTRLQKSRVSAARAAAAVMRVTSNAADFARLKAFEAYAYTTLAEGFCGNVPFSGIPVDAEIDPSLITFNPGIGTSAILDSAEIRFQAALASNSADNLAKIGYARTLLDNNKPAAAAAAVASVPTSYVYLIEHSSNSTGQNNPVFSLINNGRYGVSDLEGATTTNSTGATVAFRPDSASSPVSRPSAEGLPFRGLRDPRVPWTGPFTAFTSSFRKYYDMNNPTLDADIPLASGVEARLIEAEAQLRAGNFSGAGGTLAILNTLRASAASLITILHPQVVQQFGTALPLAPLVDPGTADSQRALFFQERALWLYNTGHRLGDLRRLVRQYGLPQSSVFPSGPYYRGGSYGADVNFPVPFAENNNPQYVPSQCVTTVA
jgi:hypothetical protein